MLFCLDRTSVSVGRNELQNITRFIISGAHMYLRSQFQVLWVYFLWYLMKDYQRKKYLSFVLKSHIKMMKKISGKPAKGS